MGSVFYSLVIYPLTQIIELVFSFCSKLFDNTGFAILGVSFAVSLLTLPLYIVAEHWQQVERDKQKAMKGEVDKIKAVFKGNEQYMILSTYYRQQHYHPIMSLRSAFGLLIQIPFFTAAYTCLSNMTALNGQSLLFIRDMGAPDSLFTIGAFHVNILPILMTLINMISGTIYTKGLPLRDKIQTYGLALVFVVILYDSPAGLVAYWTLNNLFSLVKNIFYKLKHPVWTLYAIACAGVTALIIWMFAGHVLAVKRALLVAAMFALVYFAPLFVKVSNYLIDKPFAHLKDNFKMRLGLFAASAIGLTLLVGLLLPTLLISSSPEEFCGIDGIASPLFYVGNTLSQSAGIFIIWCSLIFFLFHERMQTLIAFALSFLFGASLINSFVFMGDYGTLSKLLKFTEVSTVDSSSGMIIINLLSMLIIAAALIVIYKFKVTKFLNYFFVIISASLIFVSITNISKINKGYESYQEKIAKNVSMVKEIKPIFHLSKTGNNVFYLYIDRAQARYIEPLFEECPELYEQFSGFTFYENTVSFNGHTLLGSPPCFGGYEYTPEAINEKKSEKLKDKTNEALLLLPRIFTEQGDDYSATVTDPSWANYSWIPDLSIYDKYPEIESHHTDAIYTDLWYKEHQDTANLNVVSSTLKRNILWYGFFRVSPLVLRPAFYNDGEYWSTNKSNADYNDYLDGYSVLEYLPRFTDFDSKTKNTYVNLVNNATHDNLFLQAPDYKPATTITNFGTSEYAHNGDYHSFAGSIKRIGEWLEYLKANDCYDNTRIVIVADHGATSKEVGYEWDSKFEKIGPGHYHPLLMYKDFNSKGKLIVNEDFMTNADGPSLLLKGLIDEPKNPFTGKIVDSSAKEDGALVCLSDIFMPYHNSGEYVHDTKKTDWYRVKDNIFNSNNWTQEEH
ncbi:YidC/Oxa1 family membrane protein insertase [Treponema sp.]|uniref:YidC/Oxa1 family membrane protein insertase n=1 Tax=Treponema sp. TaxID=166 RepID=UPI0025E4A8DE|nr:YidC/Oxa1 family membrane protein insertase [Treponema sp.]MCR5218653.1 YidC/Oxa1 family membrane protein insertase [Treponema sp.]